MLLNNKVTCNSVAKIEKIMPLTIKSQLYIGAEFTILGGSRAGEDMHCTTVAKQDLGTRIRPIQKLCKQALRLHGSLKKIGRRNMFGTFEHQQKD